MYEYRNSILIAAMLLTAPMVSAQEHAAGGVMHGDANTHMNQQPFDNLVRSFESDERDAWQKPDDVVALLGDISSKTIMDIGSGTGYFSFRLVAAGAKVICADVDERFLGQIRERKTELGLDDSQMELRHVPFDSSTLAEGEADMVLIVDTYHHIEDRANYFSEVRHGLSAGGQLVVVDFKKEDLPVGPPVGMKLEAETIIEELRAAGYTNFEVNNDLLPYQYIIFAS